MRGIDMGPLKAIRIERDDLPTDEHPFPWYMLVLGCQQIGELWGSADNPDVKEVADKINESASTSV